MDFDEMNIQNGIVPGTRAIFKFRGQLLIFIWLCAVICIAGYLGISVIGRGGVFSTVVCLLILFSFFFMVGGLLLQGRSDILVDDNGISRRIFGKTWQTIRWKNVRLITAFPVYGGSGYAARAFNIFPIVKPRFRLLPSGKMCFNDKVENAPDLVELLNHNVLKHSIKVEIRETVLGSITPASRF